MRDKIREVVDKLNENLIERDEVIRLALLAAFTGENIVLVGPPGTAKSEIARRVSLVFSGVKTSYFEYLLTRFSTPEELFGPLSINELKKDRYRRNIEGYLPSAEVVFLDEIFKANSSILNALLTVLNERIYHNGAERISIPLKMLIAASNELPDVGDELTALYDRFLVRVSVNYIKNAQKLFDVSDQPVDLPNSLRLNTDDLDEVARKRRAVFISSPVQQALLAIREQHQKQFADDPDEDLSDRRFMKLLKLLKTSAVTNGRDAVDFSDLYLLPHCLWSKPEHERAVLKLVHDAVQKFFIPSVELQELEGASARHHEPVSSMPDEEKYPDFEIHNIEDWVHFCATPSLHQKGMLIHQMADLDFSSVSACQHVEFFNGTYNGNGYSISNFSITRKDSLETAGIFATLEEDSVVKNLQLNEIKISGKLYVGALAAVAKGNIQNIHANSIYITCVTETTYPSSTPSVGGLVGDATSAHFFDILVIGAKIVLGKGAGMGRRKGVAGNTGGVIGNGSKVIVCGCRLGDLSISSEGGFMGGVAGCVEDESKMEQCSVDGFKYGQYGRFGGIAGLCSDSQIRICAVQNGSVNTFDMSGGVVGVLKEGEVSDCFVSTIKVTRGGGIVGESEGQVKYCLVQGLRGDTSGVVRSGKGLIQGCVFLSGRSENGSDRTLIGDGFDVENCWAIRTTGTVEDHNPKNGKRLTQELATQQRFYEQTLGWDFKSNWRMDLSTELPVLRIAAPDAEEEEVQLDHDNAELNQQVCDNIWLNGGRA